MCAREKWGWAGTSPLAARGTATSPRHARTRAARRGHTARGARRQRKRGAARAASWRGARDPGTLPGGGRRGEKHTRPRSAQPRLFHCEQRDWAADRIASSRLQPRASRRPARGSPGAWRSAQTARQPLPNLAPGGSGPIPPPPSFLPSVPLPLPAPPLQDSELRELPQMEESNRREGSRPDARAAPRPPSGAGVRFSLDLISHFSRDQALCYPWDDTAEGRKVSRCLSEGTEAAGLRVSL